MQGGLNPLTKLCVFKRRPVALPCTQLAGGQLPRRGRTHVLQLCEATRSRAARGRARGGPRGTHSRAVRELPRRRSALGDCAPGAGFDGFGRRGNAVGGGSYNGSLGGGGRGGGGGRVKSETWVESAASLEPRARLARLVAEVRQTIGRDRMGSLLLRIRRRYRKELGPRLRDMARSRVRCGEIWRDNGRDVARCVGLRMLGTVSGG